MRYLKTVSVHSKMYVIYINFLYIYVHLCAHIFKILKPVKAQVILNEVGSTSED